MEALRLEEPPVRQEQLWSMAAERLVAGRTVAVLPVQVRRQPYQVLASRPWESNLAMERSIDLVAHPEAAESAASSNLARVPWIDLAAHPELGPHCKRPERSA